MKFTADRILDAALALLGEQGLRAVTVKGIATRLSAPSGSIYHQFASRDLLLASLWLRTVESFQGSFIEQLAGDDPRQAARKAASWVVAWARQHPQEGRLLLLYRRQDLMLGTWPASVKRRSRDLSQQVERALADFAKRLWPRRRANLPILRLGLISIPHGAVRGYLSSGTAIPAGLERAVERATLAVLFP